MLKDFLWKKSAYETNNIKIDSGANFRNCYLDINGRNNTIEIENIGAYNLRISVQGSDCHLVLKRSGYYYNAELCLLDDGSEMIIGESFRNRGVKLTSGEGKKIIIGDDNMFSYGIEVRNTDSHSITDEQGNRMNMANDVYIGNHIWCAADSMILKGATVMDNCVIGGKTVVLSGTYDKGSLIVGQPGKIKKHNITWCEERI